MKIGSIVVHCHEFDAMVRFWQAALGYVPREPGSDDWIVLRDPTGTGPNVYPWRYPKGADYVVMEDPDGNLFCVVQKVPS